MIDVDTIARILYECEKVRAESARNILAGGKPSGYEGILMEPYEECAEAFRSDARAVTPPAAQASEEEVERVARAICAADGMEPDADVSTHLAREVYTASWTQYRDLARAALSAIRADTSDAVLRERKRCAQIAWQAGNEMTKRGAWDEGMRDMAARIATRIRADTAAAEHQSAPEPKP